MSLRERFWAWMYDRMIAGPERACLATYREELLAGLRGDVIEIGGGTGANLPYYGEGVATLTVTEPSGPMIRRMGRRVGKCASDAKLVRAAAENLPFEDDSFDAAVSTLVLCSVDDQALALGELRRVLRAGGRLVFIEHVRSEEPRLARLQERMNRVNNLVAHCDCNRPTLDSIRAAGFSVEEVEHATLKKAPPFVRPLVVGVAVA
jgi:ubiquinone/menaquinone biosynthesis C-methylase UbiE